MGQVTFHHYQHMGNEQWSNELRNINQLGDKELSLIFLIALSLIYWILYAEGFYLGMNRSPHRA